MDLGKQKIVCLLLLNGYSLNVICSNCIGMRFALLEAKLAIAKALRVVEFQRCEKTEVSNYVLYIVALLWILSLGSTSVGKTSNSEQHKWYLGTRCSSITIDHMHTTYFSLGLSVSRVYFFVVNPVSEKKIIVSMKSSI